MTDFFDEVEPRDESRGIWPAYSFGPIFTATYMTECESCPEPIEPGQEARSNGHGGWIHADAMCERVARQ